MEFHEDGWRQSGSDKPVVQSFRPIPNALLGKVDVKLDKLLSAEVIEPVKGSSDWGSPMLRAKGPQRRQNMYRHEAGEAAIKREHFPLPTIEQLRFKIQEAKFFSRLDLKDAFH